VELSLLQGQIIQREGLTHACCVEVNVQAGASELSESAILLF